MLRTFLEGFREVWKGFQGRLQGRLQGVFREFLKRFQGGFREISRRFLEDFKEVSKRFQEGFRKVLGRFWEDFSKNLYKNVSHLLTLMFNDIRWPETVQSLGQKKLYIHLPPLCKNLSDLLEKLSTIMTFQVHLANQTVWVN